MSSRRRSLRHPVEEMPRRPRRSIVIDTPDDEEDDENFEDNGVEEEEDEDDDVEEEEEEEEFVESKKRARSVEVDTPLKKKKGSETNTPDPDIEEEQQQQQPEIVNDEYDLPHDPAGDLKVTPDGELQAGRTYRIKAFTVHGKSQRLYMLSTEAARLMGFRDSYLFFQRHRLLYKYITTDKQKADLVERGIMPLSYKARTIGLITARSAFREFGSKIISGGKQVVDDYYEQKARDSGAIEGAPAQPPREYHPGGSTVGNNELSSLTGGPFSAASGASAATSSSSASNPRNNINNDHFSNSREQSHADLKRYLKSTPENWIYNIASSTLHLNHFYYTSRPKFARDKYTNVKFIPQHTQPTNANIAKYAASQRGELVFDTTISGDLKTRRLGLHDLDDSIFADCVDEEVKLAIIRQRELERRTL